MYMDTVLVECTRYCLFNLIFFVFFMYMYIHRHFLLRENSYNVFQKMINKCNKL